MPRSPSPLEQSVVAHLRTVTGKPVGTRVPKPRPAEFVVVQRTGGAKRNLAQSDPSLLVQCWGATESTAWALTEQVWGALVDAELGPDLPLGVQVMRAQITEPSNYPDEATGTPRYVFIFSPTLNI